MNPATMTPKEALETLFQAAKMARLTFDEHQLVATAVNRLVAELTKERDASDVKADLR